MTMSPLTEHLARLEDWLRRSGEAPTWTGVRFVESRSVWDASVRTRLVAG